MATMARVNPHDSHAIYTKLVVILNRNHDTAIRTNQELRRMRNTTQPSDRVDYIFRLMEENNLIPDTANLEEKKSDSAAVQFRQEGNLFFKRSKFVETLKAYNKSICYAVSKESLCVSLANRSATLFKMEMYPECLETLQEIRKIIHPKRLAEKLAEREAKCKEEIEKTTPNESVLVPTIGMPVNEKIPFLAKCLAFREDATFGRHVITEEDIPAGTIIAMEEPYCKVLGTPDRYLRCATCMAEVPHRLFPCDNCTETMFCSKKCQEGAMADFHAIECPINGSLFKTFDDDLRLVFRLVISAFLAFPDSETMAPALERIEEERKNVFSFDWSKPLSREELYSPIHNLITNEDKREDEYLLMKYVMACLMFNFLKRGCPIFSQRYLTTDAGEKMLKNILYQHHLTSPMNAITIDNTLDANDYFDPDYSDQNGGFINGFASLLNHSCAQNITYVRLGTTIGVVTIKNITAGGQIFNSYGYNHKFMSKIARQTELMRRYGFECGCVACTEDYSQLHSIPEPRNIPRLPPDAREASSLCRLSFQSAQQNFHKVRDMIRDHGHLYPIVQLCEAELQVELYLNVLCGNISLRNRENVRLGKY